MRIPRSLAVALIAGILAVVISWVPKVGQTAATQLQITETTSVELPGFIRSLGNLFGGGIRKAAAPTTETKTIALNRSRVDHADGTSSIVQCDLQRMVYIDNKAKTYYVIPFDTNAKQIISVMKTMSAPRGTQTHGSGDISVTVNETADAQTKVIAGQTAHHVVDDMSMRWTGTGDCANLSMSTHVDEWYTNNPVRLYCPLAMVPMKAAQQQMPRGAQGQCMSKFRVQSNVFGHPASRYPLDETMTMNLGSPNGGQSMSMGGVHTVVTQFATQPYDASLFDAPRGYTKVTAPSMGQ